MNHAPLIRISRSNSRSAYSSKDVEIMLIENLCGKGHYDLIQNRKTGGCLHNRCILVSSMMTRNLPLFKKLFLSGRRGFEKWGSMKGIIGDCLEYGATEILNFLVAEYPFLLEKAAPIFPNCIYTAYIFDATAQIHNMMWDHADAPVFPIETWNWLLKRRPIDFGLERHLKSALVRTEDLAMREYLEKCIEECK